MRQKEIVAFIKSHKREPQCRAEGSERFLARWLQNQRSYFKRTGKVDLKAEQELSDAGFPGILRRNKKEATSNQLVRNLISWVTASGKIPSNKSNDASEAFLGVFLEKMRNKPTLFQSDIDIASAAGFPNIFDPFNREDRSNRAAVAFCLWVNSHGGRIPDRRSDDPEERRVASWYWNRRAIILGNIPGKTYTSDEGILKSQGLLYLLQTLKNPQKGKNYV